MMDAEDKVILAVIFAGVLLLAGLIVAKYYATKYAEVDNMATTSKHEPKIKNELTKRERVWLQAMEIALKMGHHAGEYGVKVNERAEVANMVLEEFDKKFGVQ